MTNGVLEFIHSSLTNETEMCAALQKFCTAGDQWLTDSLVSSFSSSCFSLTTSMILVPYAHHEPSYAINDLSPSRTILPSPSTESVNPARRPRKPILSSSSASSLDPRGAVCRIEAGVNRSGITTHPHCTLLSFTNWCFEQDVDDSCFLQYGSIRSARLFRQKQAPFYHEYIVVSFGSNGNVEHSWVRVEKGAEANGAWHQSFRPVLRGVPLRETTSFATSLHALSSSSDELASITIDAQSELPSHRMLLYELGSHLDLTSDASPHYQLFDSNCRWFARRLFMNISQRAASTEVNCVISWRGEPSSLFSVKQELVQERFGGRQLKGQSSFLIEAMALTTLAYTVCDKDARSGISLCHQSLQLLERVKNATVYHQYLLSFTTLSLATSLRVDYQRQEALIQIEEAYKTAQQLYHSIE